jgi:O-antigen/teichoic acid export membrane protein
MAILMCARMCGFPTASLYSMLYGIGSHHLMLYAGIAEAALNLVLSLILVKTMGVTGVAWGTFIPMLLGNIFFVILVFRTLNLDLAHWLKKAVLPPVLLSVAFLFIIYWVCGSFEGTTWPLFACKVASILIIYALLFLTVGINRSERGHLRDMITSRLKAATGA